MKGVRPLSGGDVTAIDVEPVTCWNVALMTALPGATPVTRPAVTVATDGADEDQRASAVTTRVASSENVAVAVNDAELPTRGATPVTEIRTVVGFGRVGDPQAAVR